METNTQNSATQTEAIKSYLLAGNTLTQLESLDRFRCLRLGARCWELRQSGYNVKSEMVKTPSGKNIASYFIPANEPLIAPSERKKEKSITLSKLKLLAKEVAEGDLLTELAFSKLIATAENGQHRPNTSTN